MTDTRKRLLTIAKGAGAQDEAWVDLVDDTYGALKLEYCWSEMNRRHAEAADGQGVIRQELEQFIKDPPSLIMLDQVVRGLEQYAAALMDEVDHPSEEVPLGQIFAALNLYEHRRGGSDHAFGAAL